MIIVDSDLIDASGQRFETVGENIRFGENGINKNSYYADITLTLDNATWDATINETNYPKNTLTANASSGEMYLTDSTAGRIDIEKTVIKKVASCVGGNFTLFQNGIHQTSGALMTAFEASATEVNIQIRCYFREDEA